MLLKILFIFFILIERIKNENETSIKGLLTVANLKISSKNNKENGILFSNQNTEYNITLTEQNEFILKKKQKPLISIDEHENIHFYVTDLSIQTFNINGLFKIMNVNQFQLIIHETFMNTTVNWKGTHNFDNSVSICGGLNLLGGYGQLSKGTIFKLFESLPNHIKIRIKVNFHFIDKWNNETAYMKVGINNQDTYIVWTDTHKYEQNNGINICGNLTPETKFISLIDIIIPHSSDKLFLEFGTNINNENANEISWGISNLQIYII